jgi:cytochrome P450
VHWDRYLHGWVVTRYRDVVEVLQTCLADRTPTPERLATLGMAELGPIARVMTRQMLFLDPPMHGRVRGLAAAAFTPRRVEALRRHIEEITDELLDVVVDIGSMDVMTALAEPLPAIVTTELLGMPRADHEQLKVWSESFAEVLGNFQHNPGRSTEMLRNLEDMVAYFRAAVRPGAATATHGLAHALSSAEVDGDRLSEDEVIANLIITMVGGLETTTNLIGNGMLALLRHPDQWAALGNRPEGISAAVEELLRFESPSQHTARLAPRDLVLGGREIRAGQAVIAVMGAANRDPDRFADPDVLDLTRTDNRHLAFGWSSHFCFGAPLARLEGAIAFEAVLRRLPELRLADVPITWRPNLGLRGLTALHVEWPARSGSGPGSSVGAGCPGQIRHDPVEQDQSTGEVEHRPMVARDGDDGEPFRVQ